MDTQRVVDRELEHLKETLRNYVTLQENLIYGRVPNSERAIQQHIESIGLAQQLVEECFRRIRIAADTQIGEHIRRVAHIPDTPQP